ncbi:hypothetical protein SNE40_016128 [Patella caerulea]|uniref:Integrase catalytic domain-containing protein n=1 Tax=Patella caerulea TaxID=87958 RepID=A0AAN8JCQ3_PATCE
MCKQVHNIFQDGGFNMRKWVSNSTELLNQIQSDSNFQNSNKQTNNQTSVKEEDEGYSKYSFSQQSTGNPKILGLIWDNQSDNLIFDFSKICSAIQSDSVTKRLVLSVASRFYDPLGLISPIVLSFKLLFQKLCTFSLDWDNELSENFVSDWKNLLIKLENTHIIQIPRCYCIKLYCDQSENELHVFGDASEQAYGTCIYLLCKHESSIHCNLLASKTRVAPLSKQTMPRLELLACLISARLAVSVVNALNHLTINQVYYWSDSQVALSWIRNTNKEYKQFVQNRVTEIRRISPIENWNYCPTSENPADISSRGSTSTELADNKKWWNGPHFLCLSKEEWPHQSSESCDQNDIELTNKSKSVVSCVISSKNNQPNLNLEAIISAPKFSRLSTLLRVSAYVLRFIHNVKCRVNQSNPNQGELSFEELKSAENLWIKTVQSNIKRDDKFNQRSVSLNLKKDNDGILRGYGRVEHSNLDYEAKYPAFLPENHHLTTLVIWKCHEDVMHNGVQETLSQFRTKYWVVRGRQIIKSVISKCVICRKLEAKAYGTPIAPPLPSFRLSDDFAFSHIGIDYAGPLFVKDIYSKSEDMHKVYIALYTCASSRALHLDLVPDASSTTFIRSFKRFIGRRGIPTSVISDNGKTFKGVELKSFLQSKGIKWRYNVERSPWWGGFFERMVRSVKRCLKKSLGTSRLTYEELLTLIIQIEGVLNSRPLTYLCDDGGEPLTPSQLVIGRRLLSEPNAVTPEVINPDSYARSKYLKTVLDHFWNRWRREYVTDLREHHKFNQTKGQSVHVGDVVIIYEDKVPRHNWNIARIERTLEGRDGNIRSAVVRVLNKSGKPILMNRPLQRLYPIELSNNEN